MWRLSPIGDRAQQDRKVKGGFADVNQPHKQATTCRSGFSRESLDAAAVVRG
jgi:hypothetical protein